MTDATMGEIVRRLNELHQGIERLEAAMVRRETLDLQLAHLDDRVASLESRSEWIVRTIGALFIGAVFGAAMMWGG